MKLGSNMGGEIAAVSEVWNLKKGGLVGHALLADSVRRLSAYQRTRIFDRLVKVPEQFDAKGRRAPALYLSLSICFLFAVIWPRVVLMTWSVFTGSNRRLFLIG